MSRDKLNIGLFDAARELLAPVAIRIEPGLGSLPGAPTITAGGLGLNGNAITVSPEFARCSCRLLPMATLPIRWSSARALARVVMDRKARGE